MNAKVVKVDPQAAVRGELKKLFSSPETTSSVDRSPKPLVAASPLPGLVSRHPEQHSSGAGPRSLSRRPCSGSSSGTSSNSAASVGLRRSSAALTGGLICGQRPAMHVLVQKARQDINSKELPSQKELGQERYSKPDAYPVPHDNDATKASRQPRELPLGNGLDGKKIPQESKEFLVVHE